MVGTIPKVAMKPYQPREPHPSSHRKRMLRYGNMAIPRLSGYQEIRISGVSEPSAEKPGNRRSATMLAR
jgi:hypothetical protein